MNQKITDHFDVIIVGGGHAGIEAAYAAAKAGSNTLLITLNAQKIGLMPCNPALGGVGKGHIVHEISALGGLMPQLATQSYIQARMLNTKKGAAVQGLRLQIDKHAYQRLAQEKLTKLKNLTIIQDSVIQIHTDSNNCVTGVRTKSEKKFYSVTVVITSGTFLNGMLHIGTKNWPGGRTEENAVTELSKNLRTLGLKLGRLKTGTPPRLQKSSVNFDVMEKQEAANLNYLFEFYPHKTNNTHACYITRTNERTHEIIKKNIHLSAMYSGNISGVGPRYCPSIEDKIARFEHRNSHQIFVEPEGVNSEELYPNGISTSLPYEVQKQYVQSIKGFENAVITKPGYAVEYDFVFPDQLHETLESKSVGGLFFAGQINGTTGYEEAAAQGLIAGINAHLKQTKKAPFILERGQSYIGVMINDLVLFGVDEPYRMFTSRAEHRLLLRQDNAFLRLTKKGYNLGLVDEQLYQDFLQEKKSIDTAFEILNQKYSQTELVRLFGQTQNKKLLLEHVTEKLSDRAIQTIHAQIRYAPYIERAYKEIEKMKRLQELIIPATLNFKNLPGLSIELQEKLTKHKPKNIAQASLIPGMTPAAISLLIFKTKSK
ncbi:tRNA uridine-5-carboxymethylaminomethyl(34) synthesis enzyme MnmG [bacterium]|nr:tRNA uridine-5-carboxymethylaminomethyl(34) synthesis enzyme MnmG [bacterium]